MASSSLITASDPKPLLQQIRLGIDSTTYESIQKDTRSPSDLCAQEHERFQEAILGHCPTEIWPQQCHLSGCPRPILVAQHHMDQLRHLHEALVAAITDIVRRWWIDTDRCFPKRMPLKSEEEDLLKWLETQVDCGNLADYSECRGSWRPDFMVEELPDSGILENFRITEINARFSFNGYLVGMNAQRALKDLGLNEYGLVGAVYPDQILNGICNLFNPELPLYLLKGDEAAFDIVMLPFVLEKYYGIVPRFVSIHDLLLVPDVSHPFGYRLYCTAWNSTHQDPSTRNSDRIEPLKSGEKLQEIHQLGLELTQRELAALDGEMLRQISLRCFNDLRTILLVHDKRMLGIVKEELENLTQRGVINDQQARILDRGIADSILPGSASMKTLLHSSKVRPNVKNDWVLKPIRGGKGSGILFGQDLSPEQWLAVLENLQIARVQKVSYVVQRRIQPRIYTVILKEEKMVQNPLIGTWHIVNGQYRELGIWRSSSGQICAVSLGGAWMGSVIPVDTT